jgi:cell wall-associated NlpC family hydrolase
MPRFTAEQIYAYARQAGFSPDQSATMTAIALAESGGDSRSHATVGEDSRGLWQINAAAHPDLAQQYDLYDPAQNARAAFVTSHGGTDVSPWTVTHGGLGARYLRFKDDAQAAAAAYGDGPNHGIWTGTAGYGHPLSAGDPTGRGAAPATPGTHGTEGSDAVVVNHGAAGAVGAVPGADFGIPLEEPAGTDYGIPLEALDGVAAPTGAAGAAGVAPAAATPGSDDHLHTFLAAANGQRGDQYIFGVMDRLDDPNPKAFDCSMLVQWSAHQAGVDVPRNAWDQYQFLHDRGMVIPVDQAIHTPGALLFSFNSDPNGSRPVQQHVAISLGDGKTIEARGSQYGVDSFDATPRRFQYAAVIPGISDHVTPGSGVPAGIPTTDAHGGVVVAPLVDTSHPVVAPVVSQVAAPVVDPHAPPPGNDFTDRLAQDPDHLDSGSAVGGAPPPGAAADPHAPVDPHAAPHEPLYFTLVDANDDGLDDSLQEAGNVAGPHADDGWDHHAHGPGHT